MKQLLFIILAICLILMMGCQSENHFVEPTETDPSVMDATWQDINSTHQTESTGEFTSATEERSDTVPPTQTVSSGTTPPPTEGTAKNDNTEPATTVDEWT